MAERTNAEWLADLSSPGPARDSALEDLRSRLTTGLRYALRSYASVQDDDVADFVQEALLKVLDNLHTFRGESRFLTWAQKIAVHLAISELRRLRWRDVPLMRSTEDGQEVELIPDPAQLASSGRMGVVTADASASPEESAIQTAALAAVRRAIAEDLTERQRQALTAVVIQGMPMAQVADKMGTNRNALYKLLHDARKRLKKGLLASGVPASDILSSFGA